jgi:hypothetical protein
MLGCISNNDVLVGSPRAPFSTPTEGKITIMRFVKVAFAAAVVSALATASLMSPVKANTLPQCPTGQHLTWVPAVGYVCR